MKLLSFLGVARYETTCYIWQDQDCTTRFSLVASTHFLNPDTLILFLTEEAQQEHWAEIRSAIPASVEIIPVQVPHGQNETELWSIFAQIGGAVQPGEEVAFDITNGFRSFPLVGLLAAAFLRTGLDVRLKAVLYGAFDVRDKSVEPSRTPMFDLSPMIALLEWSAAADRFNRTGDARYLAGLVKEQKKALALQDAGDRKMIEQAGALGLLASNLTDISQALHLIRPALAMELTAALPGKIEKARPALDGLAPALPFGILLDGVRERFEPLGLADPLESENLPAALQRQRLLIQRYADWELWVQAVTLAREWLVSWFMLHLEYETLTAKTAREQATERINSEANSLRMADQRGDPTPRLGLEKYTGGLEALRLWNATTDVRNDIDHAGMREDPRDPRSLIQNVEKIIQGIHTLPIPGGAP